MLGDAAEELSAPFSGLSNGSMLLAVFPIAENVGKIISVFKSGDQTRLDSSRPVSASIWALTREIPTTCSYLTHIKE